MSEEERRFWLGLRQALLMALAHIEERLGLPRSVPRRKDRRRKE